MRDEFKAAARKTALSVAAACFGLALNYAKSSTAALEFASGYLVEQSPGSVDKHSSSSCSLVISEYRESFKEEY